MTLAQPPIWFILIAFVCAIGPLVIIHELGHYLVARWFGVGVEAFSINFGHEIFGWTDKRGTRWKVGWLPLGGYVRFVGDEHVASQAADPDTVAPADRERSFHLKPVWQRFLVVLAGPMANFLLAILIFAAFFAVLGVPRTPAVVSEVKAGSVAQQVGIQPGDRITAIAGKRIATFEQLRREIILRPAEKVEIVLDRDGTTERLRATIGVHEERDQYGQKYRIGLLGVGPVDRVLERVPVTGAVPFAAAYAWEMTRATFVALGQIVTGRRSAKELGGPLKMAQIAGQQANLGAFEFVSLLALFSINLGFINLLPVPMLDGGHLLFYTVEAVRRRPVSARAQDWAFRGGLALILALIVFTTVNDLSSFGLWDGLERLIG